MSARLRVRRRVYGSEPSAARAKPLARDSRPVRPRHHDRAPTPSLVLGLQATHGNQFVSRLLAQRDGGRAVAPVRYAPAESPAAYVQLVRELERTFSALPPRSILAMLRQVYYGRPWSADPNVHWAEVLPASPSLGDPRTALGTGPGSLFDALRRSQDTIPQLDIGHTLAGLEALLDPTRQVELETPGPNVVAAIPNTEFATWGGDVGSAAGQAAVDLTLNRPARSDVDYFNDLANPADLEGNIDAFAVAAGARDRSGSLRNLVFGSGSGSSGLPTRMSDILGDYYLRPSTVLGSARANRFRHFAVVIGCRLDGNRIVNQAEIERGIIDRVASFAELWFYKEYRNARGTLVAGATRLGSAAAVVTAVVRVKSMAMVRLFFAWLSTRLAGQGR